MKGKHKPTTLRMYLQHMELMNSYQKYAIQKLLLIIEK